jgi:hypothetical protein
MTTPETDPESINEATKRIRRAKEIKRAEMMMELALEAFAEHEGMEATRDRLIVYLEATIWY